MRATRTSHLLALGVLAATMAAAAPSWFEAHTTGAKVLSLRGTAEFGPVRGPDGSGPFVLSMGAASSTGALVFTASGGARPKPGVYRLGENPSEGMQALVVTGPATRPTGAFRARSGTLTVTRSRDDVIEGRFEIDAVGFMASDPADEERGLTVRGSFTASPSAPRQEGTPGMAAIGAAGRSIMER